MSQLVHERWSLCNTDRTTSKTITRFRLHNLVELLSSKESSLSLAGINGWQALQIVFLFLLGSTFFILILALIASLISKKSQYYLSILSAFIAWPAGSMISIKLEKKKQSFTFILSCRWNHESICLRIFCLRSINRTERSRMVFLRQYCRGWTLFDQFGAYNDPCAPEKASAKVSELIYVSKRQQNRFDFAFSKKTEKSNKYITNVS